MIRILFRRRCDEIPLGIFSVQWINTGGLKQKHKENSLLAKNQSSEIRLSESANKKRSECVMRAGMR